MRSLVWTAPLVLAGLVACKSGFQAQNVDAHPATPAPARTAGTYPSPGTPTSPVPGPTWSGHTQPGTVDTTLRYPLPGTVPVPVPPTFGTPPFPPTPSHPPVHEPYRFRSVAEAESELANATRALDALLAKTTTGSLLLGDGSCSIACAALASMQRATAALCELTSESDARCTDAHTRVSDNERRVREAGCSCVE